MHLCMAKGRKLTTYYVDRCLLPSLARAESTAWQHLEFISKQLVFSHTCYVRARIYGAPRRNGLDHPFSNVDNEGCDHLPRAESEVLHLEHMNDSSTTST